MTTIAATMPSMLRHAGLWQGTYRHLDAQGQLVDQHQASVRCVFPADGPFAYIQHNHFTWADGREVRAELPGVLRDGRLWWDTPTFAGSAWETAEGVILLKLDRKDEPGAHFVEVIVLGPTGTHRARTWHWFRDGALYRRTLCDEVLVEPVPGLSGPRLGG
jgi:hypothetical protein